MVMQSVLSLGHKASHPYPLPAGGERGASTSMAYCHAAQRRLAATLTTPAPRFSRGEGKGEGQREVSENDAAREDCA
jgi:hypothetical protein